MNKKLLVLGGGGLIIIGIVLVLLLVAGAGIYLLYFTGDGGGQQLPQQENVLQRKDLDGDGVSDKFTYVFPKEEIEGDVFLQRTAVYEKDAGGSYRGTLSLEFENTGSEDKTFTYVMKIPKSFAAHVRDLDFDVPPTKIIQEDPEVSWEVRVMERSRTAIKIGAAIDLGVGKAKEKWSEWFGGEQKPSEEDAIAGAVMAGVGDIGFETAMRGIEKVDDGAGKETLRMVAVMTYPDKFIIGDCEGLGEYDKTSKPICKAVLTEDWRECTNVEDEEDVDYCKEYLYKSLARKCETIKEQTLKDLCFYKAAVKADWVEACEDIVDTEGVYLKEQCRAEVTQDMGICKKIPEQRIKENCCRKLMNPDEQAECMGTNTTTTTTLFHLPTNLELLQETDKLSVGVYLYGRGIDREEGVEIIDVDSASFNCYNQGNLTWNGRLFSGSGTWTRQEFDGRTLKYRQVLEGAVTEEADKIVWLTCEWYRDDRENPQSTEVYWHKLQFTNVPLNHTAYGAEFGSTIKGPTTEHYFSGQPESYDKQVRGTKVYEFTHFQEVIWDPPENTDIKNHLSVSFRKQ
jgi:hypothetical protein